MNGIEPYNTKVTISQIIWLNMGGTVVPSGGYAAVSELQGSILSWNYCLCGVSHVPPVSVRVSRFSGVHPPPKNIHVHTVVNWLR